MSIYIFQVLPNILSLSLSLSVIIIRIVVIVPSLGYLRMFYIGVKHSTLEIVTH
jgi:hypothetical protein